MPSPFTQRSQSHTIQFIRFSQVIRWLTWIKHETHKCQQNVIKIQLPCTAFSAEYLSYKLLTSIQNVTSSELSTIYCISIWILTTQCWHATHSLRSAISSVVILKSNWTSMQFQSYVLTLLRWLKRSADLRWTAFAWNRTGYIFCTEALTCLDTFCTKH